MATNTAAQLLIRIAADPSQAEESIGKFRSSFGGDLGLLSTQMAQWSAQGSADFSRLQATSLQFSGRARTDFNTLEELLSRSRASSTLWRSEFVSNLESVRNSSLQLQASLVGGFLIFDSALTRNVTNAIIWQKSIGQAFTKAAVTAVGAIAQEALVRAIFSTALGFYLLAIRDFRGAANAFQSAALFGAVGGAAALAGRALAGGGSAGSGSSSTSQPSAASQTSSSPPAQASASQASPEQKTVQVIFQGPVYGGQAGIDELVRQISRAVTDRDVNLVAYTVVRQPATRA